MGCALEAIIENGQVVSVTGNTCPRGAAYAKSECVHPTRVLTTTLRVNGGEKPLVSAKSAGAIPKELLFRAMEEINAARAEAPVELGQVLLPDLCGTGGPPGRHGRGQKRDESGQVRSVYGTFWEYVPGDGGEAPLHPPRH